LIFLALDSPEEAIDRVEMRVRQGGHNVPPEIIRRRFAAGRRNFRNTYRHLVNYWRFVDNSRDPARLLKEGVNP